MGKRSSAHVQEKEAEGPLQLTGGADEAERLSGDCFNLPARNRGKKLRMMDAEERAAMRVHASGAIIDGMSQMIAEAKWHGKQTTTRLFAYIPGGDPQDVRQVLRHAMDLEAGDVPVADILQPAASLDNIVQRPELCALFKPRHIESVSTSVNSIIQSEVELHNVLARFTRTLQKDDPELFKLDFGEVGKRAREAAYAVQGSSNEIICQLQEIEQGLTHVSHQQQFLWRMIKDRVRVTPARVGRCHYAPLNVNTMFEFSLALSQPNE